MSKTTAWWWVRHAPVRNQDGRIYGRRDVAADLSDHAAIGALAARLPEGAVWLASPLARARDTAKKLLEMRAGSGKDSPALAIEPDLIEQDFGSWQGQTYVEIAKTLGGETHPLAFTPAHVTPKGGESFADMIPRVAHAIERLTGDNKGRDIVAVAHAGVIRAALAVTLRLEAETALQFAIDPLLLTRLDYLAGPGLWCIASVNESA